MKKKRRPARNVEPGRRNSLPQKRKRGRICTFPGRGIPTHNGKEKRVVVDCFDFKEGSLPLLSGEEVPHICPSGNPEEGKAGASP